MTEINDQIWAAPTEFPAVTEIDRGILEAAAQDAANQMILRGHAFLEFSPEDGTRYVVMIVESPTASGVGAPFQFASNMGPVHAWNGTPTVHPEYAAQNFVVDCGRWTATVFALFLNSVSALMHNRNTPSEESK
jgi:hypothetical protein